MNNSHNVYEFIRFYVSVFLVLFKFTRINYGWQNITSIYILYYLSNILQVMMLTCDYKVFEIIKNKAVIFCQATSQFGHDLGLQLRSTPPHASGCMQVIFNFLRWIGNIWYLVSPWCFVCLQYMTFKDCKNAFYWCLWTMKYCKILLVDQGRLLTSSHLTVCRHGAPIAPGFKTKNTFNLSESHQSMINTILAPVDL